MLGLLTTCGLDTAPNHSQSSLRKSEMRFKRQNYLIAKILYYYYIIIILKCNPEDYWLGIRL